MAVAFLLDEDIERRLAKLLENDGYDVERVVNVDALGSGTDDDEIRAYAKRSDRIIVTYDDHHIAVPSAEHAGVFYCPTQQTQTQLVFRVIKKVLSFYSDRNALPAVIFLSPDNWLPDE